MTQNADERTQKLCRRRGSLLHIFDVQGAPSWMKVLLLKPFIDVEICFLKLFCFETYRSAIGVVKSIRHFDFANRGIWLIYPICCIMFLFLLFGKVDDFNLGKRKNVWNTVCHFINTYSTKQPDLYFLGSYKGDVTSLVKLWMENTSRRRVFSLWTLYVLLWNILLLSALNSICWPYFLLPHIL